MRLLPSTAQRVFRGMSKMASGSQLIPQGDNRFTMSTTFNKVTTGSEEWYTPPEIVHSLGQFDLDPCFSPPSGERPWDTALLHYSKTENGLAQTWTGRVWCNPPYGRGIDRWLSKCARHNNCIALVFARTDTAVWQEQVFTTAAGALFLSGRIKFIDCSTLKAAKHAAPAPAVLIAWGENNMESLARCGLKGALVRFR